MIRDAKFLIKLHFKTMKYFCEVYMYTPHELKHRIARWDKSGHSGDVAFNAILDKMYEVKCKELNIHGIRFNKK